MKRGLGRMLFSVHPGYRPHLVSILAPKGRVPLPISANPSCRRALPLAVKQQSSSIKKKPSVKKKRPPAGGGVVTDDEENESASYQPSPLPKRPAGFVLDSHRRVLMASPKRIATIISE